MSFFYFISGLLNPKSRSSAIVKPVILFCNSSGIHLQHNEDKTFVNWTEIERIEAYKLDLVTTDCICTRITYSDKQLVLTEGMQGWQEFTEASNKFLTGVKDSWYGKVMTPPFESNLMTIYERGDRIMPAGNNFYAELFNKKSGTITPVFQTNGWIVRKISFTDFEFINNWSELILSENDGDLLLHGAIAYHPENINAIKLIFDSFECSYNMEFYEDQKLIQQFKKQ